MLDGIAFSLIFVIYIACAYMCISEAVDNEKRKNDNQKKDEEQE